MHFSVKVFCRSTCYIQSIYGAGDFHSACETIMKEGLFTANQNGPVWFPPWAIEAVVLDDDLGGFE